MDTIQQISSFSAFQVLRWLKWSEIHDPSFQYSKAGRNTLSSLSHGHRRETDQNWPGLDQAEDTLFSLTVWDHLCLRRHKRGGQGIQCGGQEEQRCTSRIAIGMFEDSEPSAVWGSECWRPVSALRRSTCQVGRPSTDPNSSHSSCSLVVWDYSESDH